MLGHVVDKIEWIIIGGTFHSYPEPYLDHYFEQGWRGFNLYKHFSGRFQGKYAPIIKKWVLNGGLQRTLLEIPEWEQILVELGALKVDIDSKFCKHVSKTLRTRGVPFPDIRIEICHRVQKSPRKWTFFREDDCLR